MILALSPRVNFVVDKESIDCLSPSILADRKCREISCFLFIISSFFHAWLFFFPMMFMASERKPFSTLQTLDFHSVWMPQVFCFAHWHFYLHIIHLHVHVILWSNRSQGCFNSYFEYNASKMIDWFFSGLYKVSGQQTCPLYIVILDFVVWGRTSACKGTPGSRYQSIFDLTQPTHTLAKDSHNTGNVMPYSFQIVCGFFNFPHWTYKHGRYLRDGTYGL